MIKRLLVLVFFIGAGILLFQNIEISSSWQKAQAFVEDNLGEGIFEEIKEGRLEGKAEGLEKKLRSLSQDLRTKAEEGTDKYEEIEATVLETKRALEVTKAALYNLQSSAEKSAGILGIMEKTDEDPPSYTPSNTTTNTYHQTIIRTVPKAEIESFCKEFIN